jgi:peroxiredoxin
VTLACRGQRRLIELYGLSTGLLGGAKRTSLVIGRDGRITKIVGGLSALNPAVTLAACSL